MKKVIFGLLLLVGSVLFLINHLAGITSESTNKVSDNAQRQLIATDSKLPITNAKPAEDKSITEQMTNSVMPLVKQVTDNALEQTKQLDDSSKKPKPPIATIKIYDKKTNQEITIETPTQLEAQRQSLTLEQQQEQKNKDDRFRAYYHKSEQCLSPSDQETRVACGNEYIRAKAKFEELYKQGKY
jgi:hypothetical protein